MFDPEKKLASIEKKLDLYEWGGTKVAYYESGGDPTYLDEPDDYYLKGPESLEEMKAQIEVEKALRGPELFQQHLARLEYPPGPETTPTS